MLSTLSSDTIKKNSRKDGSIFAKWIEQRVLEELVRLMSMTSWSSLGRACGLPSTLLVASASVLPVAEEELPPGDGDPQNLDNMELARAIDCSRYSSARC